MTIGSLELAEELRHASYERCPTGWTFLDEGSYRRVFRGPDGFVYKKNLYDGLRKMQGYNAFEAETFQRLTDRGFIWVPTFTLYETKHEDIMVIPFLRDTQYQDWRGSDNENLKRYREIGQYVADSGEENTGVDPQTGLIYIRDGGNGVNRYAWH